MQLRDVMTRKTRRDVGRRSKTLGKAAAEHPDFDFAGVEPWQAQDVKKFISQRIRSVAMRNRRIPFTKVLGAFAFTAMAAIAAPDHAHAQKLKGTTLRVAVVADMTNFDPMQFSLVNFHLIKNLYDSLIEYTPDGKAVPSLATEWSI